MKTFSILTIIGVFFLSGCAITHSYGPFKGKVVEAEAEEPIPHVAALFVFSTEMWDPFSKLADMAEVLTDQKDEFNIPKHRIFVSRPFSREWPEGRNTGFKSEYSLYQRHKSAFDNRKKYERLSEEMPLGFLNHSNNNYNYMDYSKEMPLGFYIIQTIIIIISIAMFLWFFRYRKHFC